MLKTVIVSKYLPTQDRLVDHKIYINDQNVVELEQFYDEGIHKHKVLIYLSDKRVYHSIYNTDSDMLRAFEEIKKQIFG